MLRQCENSVACRQKNLINDCDAFYNLFYEASRLSIDRIIETDQRESKKSDSESRNFVLYRGASCNTDPAGIYGPSLFF